MQLMRVDTRRAYDLIRDRITTLEMAPGSQINEQHLADAMGMGVAPVREALVLLAHEGLVVITPRHGMYVAEVNLPDLLQLSEMRLALESLSARLAAVRSTPDDLAVLEALRGEQPSRSASDGKRLLDMDHKFHQAIATAAHNKYLADALDTLFGLSQRLWYLALPNLGFLPAAVDNHLELVEAIRKGRAEDAERIMLDHVQGFYDRVREILSDDTAEAAI